MPKYFAFARTIFQRPCLTCLPGSEMVGHMQIKERPKKRRRWSPDDVIEKEYQRLPQLNKFFKNRRMHGFGG